MSKATRRKNKPVPVDVRPFSLDLYLTPTHICAYDGPAKECSKCRA